ncbi:MAG: ABC transporter ATP-binding protein [Microthrixaceae bacterium]
MSTRRRSKAAKRDKPVIPAVRADGLEKSYGEVTALAEIDLEVPQGEAVVLVGHNGSGKSTLLGLLAGTMEPSEGSVEIFGAAPGIPRARVQRAWLPDNPVLYDDLTVREHLEYVSRLHGGDADDDAMDELLERLDLAGRSDDLPSQFSRGLRQKTAIAVAMCRPFSLLLVDEPFVGLDARGRTTMLALLAEASERGATLMVATHDPDVIDTFDRGLMLENGELLWDGPASKLPAQMAEGGSTD